MEIIPGAFKIDSHPSAVTISTKVIKALGSPEYVKFARANGQLVLTAAAGNGVSGHLAVPEHRANTAVVILADRPTVAYLKTNFQERIFNAGITQTKTKVPVAVVTLDPPEQSFEELLKEFEHAKAQQAEWEKKTETMKARIHHLLDTKYMGEGEGGIYKYSDDMYLERSYQTRVTRDPETVSVIVGTAAFMSMVSVVNEQWNKYAKANGISDEIAESTISERKKIAYLSLKKAGKL